MKAIILAGGKGTRLKPYTNILPKPLMPIGEYPIMDIVIRQLKKAAFDEIIISVGYLSHLIESYFKNGENWNIKIKYSKEEKPLGTAGPLSLIKSLDDDFLLMNGDILTDLNFNKFYKFHIKSKSIATIAIFNKKLKINLGTLNLNHNFQITDYIEKPTLEYIISAGIYIFSPRIKKYIKTNEYLDLPDLIKMLIKNKEQVIGYPIKGMWFDLGNKEDYEEINLKYSDSIQTFFS